MKVEGVIEGAIRQNSRFGEVGRRVCNKHCHLESPFIMNPLIDRDQCNLYISVSTFFLCGSPHTWQILDDCKGRKSRTFIGGETSHADIST
jgi:hypothetical protein